MAMRRFLKPNWCALCALLFITGSSAATELQIHRSPVTGELDALYRDAGALTEARSGVASVVIAREFLAEQRDLYGLSDADIAALVVLGESPGGSTGLRMLRLEQRIDGVPIFNSETRVLLDRDGRVWRVLGALLPSKSLVSVKVPLAQLITSAAALDQLFAQSGNPLAEAASAMSGTNGDWQELHASAPVVGSAWAKRVLFPISPGVLVPAWALVAYTNADADWYGLIDAKSGELLWRTNMRENASTQQARFSVYVQADGKTPADSPAPAAPNAAVPGVGTQFPAITRSIVNMLNVQDSAASPNGWLDDCPSAANGCDSTRGNNVEACLDRDATDNVCDASLDANGRAIANPDSFARNRDFLGAAPRDFDYTPAPLLANPDAGDIPTNPDSQRGALVQAFYTINWFHDRVLALGFDEGSGNFQQLNLLGQGGLAGDRIAADIQNAGSNAGDFSTPPDGVPGRMQLSLFTGPAPDRDIALDANIIVHELTHGMTHRLIGNSNGLLWDVARSMGEGWSDFYAMALLNGASTDDPNARYPFAPWTTYKLSALTDNYVYGFRRFPYSTDNTVNPLTFEDIDAVTKSDVGGIAPSPLNQSAVGALEVHNAGSIWANTLWEIRAGIIARFNGDVAAGNNVMLQLVTDALKLTPANPSFIDGRDAIIAADCATNGCANEREIWQGFADRGLGYKAIAPQTVGGRFALTHIGIGTSFVLPQLDVINPNTAVVIDDAFGSGNGNARLDPGETVALTIALTNPLRLSELAATGITATLSTTSPMLQIIDATATYPNIAPQATQANATAFKLQLRADAVCGSAIPFELKTMSSLGMRIAKFSLRIGVPGAAAAPVTFTATPNLLIPISSVDGVQSPLAITQDFEISDLNFRLNSLTHPVSGQLSVMLRAPNGYGVDLIWRRGGFMVPNQGPGADFLNVEIDDDLPIVAAWDLNQSLSTQAPFSGNWLPAFNSPFWNSYRPNPPNPPADINRDVTGQLSRLDGLSTQGNWLINIANGSNTQTGTLASWSLVVQPRAFSCEVFVPLNLIFRDSFE